MTATDRAAEPGLRVRCCCGKLNQWFAPAAPLLAAAIVRCTCGLEWILRVNRRSRRASLEPYRAKERAS